MQLSRQYDPFLFNREAEKKLLLLSVDMLVKPLMHYVQFLCPYFKRLLRSWLDVGEDLNESYLSAGKLGLKTHTV